jgi:uncharacterized membrane protein
MWKVPEEIEQLEVFKKNAKTVGVILMVIGFLGAIFPVAASLTTVVFVSWMLLMSAFLVGYFTYKSDAEDIKKKFGLSKKNFKRTLTELIESKKIVLLDSSIKLI